MCCQQILFLSLILLPFYSVGCTISSMAELSYLATRSGLLSQKKNYKLATSSNQYIECILVRAGYQVASSVVDCWFAVQEDEARLLKQVFRLMRSGQHEAALAACNLCGQPWRAASLEGWRLHHDPNYGSRERTTEKLPVEGNPHRYVDHLSYPTTFIVTSIIL